MSYRLDKSFQELAQLKLADMFRSDIRLLGFYSLSRKKNIMNRIEKIKTHWNDHKKVYIATATGITIGAAGVLAVVARPGDTAQIVQKIHQIAWRPENNQVVVNMIERSTSSKPVHLVGTNLYFNSLSEAARETGHSLSSLSKHVNGHISDIGGDVFELLEKAN